MAYIDKSEAVKHLMGACIAKYPSSFYVGLYAAGEEIKTLAGADVEEVKHGRWIEKEEIYGDIYYTCSNCNNDWATIDGTPQENFMNYCPNCGAKMDGEKKATIK